MSALFATSKLQKIDGGKMIAYDHFVFLFSSETVSTLLDHMFNGERMESVVVNGVSILQTMLECRKVR